MGNEIEIRAFEINEQERVRKLILEGLGEHFGYIDETCNPDIDDIYSNYIQKGYIFVTAYLDSELVGTGALICEGEGIGRIVRMSVDKVHRKHGIGKKIVTNLLEEAKTIGYKKILLATETNWEAAIALYKSCGFIEYDRDAIDVHMYKEI